MLLEVALGTPRRYERMSPLRIGRTAYVQRIGAYLWQGVTVDQHVAATRRELHVTTRRK
jgi:hypothetical protein